MARLDECVAALGDDENLAALRSYAMKRHADASSHVLVRRLRRRRDDTDPVDPDVLQLLLDWLLREELDAGSAAFRAGSFQKAQHQFTAAAAIDDRCAPVTYLHAAALFRELISYLETDREVQLDHAHRLLVRARHLAARCADDPAVGAPSKELSETIRVILSVVEAAQARVARAKAVNDCISRYNTLVQHYQRFPIRTVDQRDTARQSFDTLDREVLRLQRQANADAQEQAVLVELASAIASVRTQLFRR